MVVETSRFALPPVEPIFLTWENLKVVAKRGNRLLLDNVMGIAQPGQLIALMGASGAGKTTLLNALLQRNIKGLIIEGTILVNGQEIGRKITKVSAYIQQQNLFIGTLTVKEHLTLQAQLRLPASFDKEQRQLRVTQVMTELDLKGCESSVIGVAGIKKGITSGEAKRLSFATEILTNPSLLFADEPTTGIDSYMAFQVVKVNTILFFTVLERLACESRKTIICTIHQPASEIFEMFDRVLFLANAGVAFLGSPAEAVQFFGDCGHMIPEHSNPADFFIQTLAIVPGNEQQCTERAERIKTAFLLSKYGQRVQNLCAVSNREAAVQLVERGKASLFTLTSTLFQRSFIDNWRNPSLLRAKMVQKCVMGTFLGLLYLQTTMTQDGVINIKGALFYYISELTYSTMFGIQTFMPSDFPLLVREYHDGIYPVICYHVAKILSYLPIFTMDGMVMVFVSYFMIGLHAKMGTFLNTLLTCMLIEWSTASVGIMISSVSPSYAVAVSISGPLLTVFSITGGLYTNIKKIPEWIRWVQYFSWFRFGYESLITNEFRHHSNITCDLDSGKPATICESSGEVVMSNLNFDLSNLYFNMWMMAFYIICVYTIGYVGLVITTHGMWWNCPLRIGGAFTPISPPPQPYCVVTKVLNNDRSTFEEKAKTAVVIGLPHAVKEHGTKIADNDLVKEDIIASGISAGSTLPTLSTITATIIIFRRKWPEFYFGYGVILLAGQFLYSHSGDAEKITSSVTAGEECRESLDVLESRRIRRTRPLYYFIWKPVYYFLYKFLRFIFRSFERIADYCDKGVGNIPLTFILGFFVNIIVQRWTDAFKNMGYLEKLLSFQAIHLSSMILGDDDDARLMRRTIARYLCLAQVIVFRDLSVRVRKRFPTMESLVKAGFMMDHEKAKMESYKLDYDKYWVPINWAFGLVLKARTGGKILADTYAVKICDEIRNFRNGLQMLCNYDWVEIPLVYPQVVFLSVHTYFIVCLIGRQFIIGVDAPNRSQVDIVFPIMTMLQYLFFVGWMKVAEGLLNPFGEDDDDFECNFLIDKNLATSLCIVDEAHDDLPPLEKDLFWSISDVEPLYSKDTASIPINPLMGSAARAAG
ncbi:unnamed protein product [Toxocara canis]|uniref:ABC transporter domain-containing protein n=1 Tax=Toxocara canis TaxID=6265 RepID=A0A183UPD8_TOXCA|nr:unnamed protein product [Toxocara canis]